MKKKMVLFVILGFIFLYSAKQALACKGTEVIFEDNFATLDPAWGDPSDRQSVKDGKLIISNDTNSGSSVLNQGNIFSEDIDFCVTAKLTKADDESGGPATAGILFWGKDYGDYYYLYVGGGKFTVARWVGGRWLYPVSGRENAAIKKGVGESNHLRVVTKGDQAVIYINDTEMVTFKGKVPQGGGLIGVRGEGAVKSPSVWEFSDLKVTKIIDVRRLSVHRIHCTTTRRHDSQIVLPLVEKTKASLQSLYGDAGYDSKFVRDSLRKQGIRPVIKHRIFWNIDKAHNARLKGYGKRSMSECVNSMIKRRYGDFVSSKSWNNQFKEMTLKCLVHNIDRMMVFVIGFLRS